MSLINDALKRASQAQPTPPTPAESAPPLRPAEHKPRASWPMVVLPLVLLFVLALAGWFLTKGWQATRQLSENRVPVSARENKLEDLPKNQSAQTNSKTEQAISIAAEPVATQGSITNAESPTTEPPKPAAPVLKLQGIFYRPSRPSAMINSKTVFVGDKVAQAKVLAIDRESVTLESDGQTKVLTLP